MKRLWAAVLFVAACGGQPVASSVYKADAAAPAPLLATVTVSGMTASVVLENRSAGAISLPGQVLDSAQLLLEVRDARDHVVPTIPPPTPTNDVRSILAGDRVTCSLSLDVFSPPLRPGDYTVRVKGADIESNVAPLHVK